MKNITLAILLTFSLSVVSCGKDNEDESNVPEIDLTKLASCSNDFNDPADNSSCVHHSETRTPNTNLKENDNFSADIAKLLADREGSEEPSFCKKMEQTIPSSASSTIIMNTYVCLTN